MSALLDFVPDLTVNQHPVAAAAGDGLYLAFKDTGNGFIWTKKLTTSGWATSSQDQARPGTSTVPTISSIPADFGGEAMLVWTGASDAPTQIFYATVTGSNYGNQVQLKCKNGTPATNYTPAAAVFKDTLYIAWIEANSPNGSQVYIVGFNSTSNDASQQTMQAVPLPDGVPITQGDGTIALAADDNNLVFAWVTGSNTEGIKWATSSDGVKWNASAAVDTADTTMVAPVFLPYQGRTCLVAYSVKNNEIVLKSYDGKSWTGESAIPFTHTRTVSYPAAATFQNRLHIFWMLSNGDVAWVQFDGFTPDAAPSPLPPQLSWSGSSGLGTGPSNANFSSNLVLNQDGTVQYSGTWNDTGNEPILHAPSQNYVVEYVVVDSSNNVYTFPQTGNVPTASSGPWNVTAQSGQIKQNWEALSIGAYCKVLASDTSDVSSLFSSFVSAFATIVGTVIEVLA